MPQNFSKNSGYVEFGSSTNQFDTMIVPLHHLDQADQSTNSKSHRVTFLLLHVECSPGSHSVSFVARIGDCFGPGIVYKESLCKK